MLRKVFSKMVPKRIILRRYAASAWRQGEPELRTIPILCCRDKAAVDIGANYGVYSFFMMQHSARVTAIEPNPYYAAFVRDALPGVEVVQAAASDHEGEAMLRLPTAAERRGMATVEANNRLDVGDETRLRVRLVTLDSLRLNEVAFMKIDVEGHELAALQGAKTTIERDRPAILIEAEERHRPHAVGSVREFLAAYDYEGFFMVNGGLAPIETFDLGIHQDAAALAGTASGKVYVNNFLFLHRESSSILARLAVSVGP